MKFSYKFHNLLGTVYRHGNLAFTSDGNSVISPVGNRITVFDLKNNRSSTLPVESRFNYTALDLSPNGNILVAVNEDGEAHLISLISQTIIHKYRFKGRVNFVKFSPDGKHFAACKENKVFIFRAPGPFSGQFNAFVMERVFHGAFDETTCLDWSSDSRILAIGSKDMSTKLYPIEKYDNFRTFSLGGHTDCVVGCFFEKNSLDITTISRNGQACVWECVLEPDDLVKWNPPPPKKKQRKSSDSEEDDIDLTKSLEKTEEMMTEAFKDMNVGQDEPEKKAEKKILYKKLAKHYLSDEVKKDSKNAELTAAAYNKDTKILVTGYSTGAFFIYELPEVNLIHSLSISNQSITTISLNNTGDWIALGCSGLGQLLVWEWQSETYVMKQQGHSNNMSCVSYSGDGHLIATGGEDGKVKLWNVSSGFCFVTFTEHSNAVSAIAFSGAKKFVVSASLDGTVRAYDVMRYRNFRTLTTPRPVQLACVAVDVSGEFVAAGGRDVFEIFLWSMKTGRLLEVLSGHEGPVVSTDRELFPFKGQKMARMPGQSMQFGHVWQSYRRETVFHSLFSIGDASNENLTLQCSLAFSPNPTSTLMASVSWDKTVRIWDAIEKGSAHETIPLTSDGLCVVFKPDGREVAVATLDGQITVFDVKTTDQVANIEGRYDLGSGRSDTDLITAKKSLEAKSFTSLCYSADGEFIIAGGQSKNVCIYNVKEAMIVKKFEITQNRSFDAVDDFINRRKLTEFGNLALVEERHELEGGNVAIRLPGVKKGDMASRSFKPEVRVFSLQFSPTGQQWCAATTEGLLIYSLQSGLVFDPWDLQIGITPTSVRDALKKEDFVNALTMAMKLNEVAIINEVVEGIPTENIELVVTNLEQKCVERLLVVVANALENSRHLEFYLFWAQSLLTIHGMRIRPQNNMSALLSLQKSLTKRYQQLSKICDFNTYTMRYVARLGEVASKEQLDVAEVESKSEDEKSDSDMEMR